MPMTIGARLQHGLLLIEKIDELDHLHGGLHRLLAMIFPGQRRPEDRH